jgi:hypothetical protein
MIKSGIPSMSAVKANEEKKLPRVFFNFSVNTANPKRINKPAISPLYNRIIFKFCCP